MTPDDRYDLRVSLEAAFDVELTAEFDDRFLDAVMAATTPEARALADEWGWDDSEVRDAVCDTAYRLLGIESTGRAFDRIDAARTAYARWSDARDAG